MGKNPITIDNYLDNHHIHRSNWLRAAVLVANDGIISISSLAIGITTASTLKEPILLATVAGLLRAPCPWQQRNTCRSVLKPTQKRQI